MTNCDKLRPHNEFWWEQRLQLWQGFPETHLNSRFFFMLDDVLLVIHLNFLKTSDI